MTNHIMSQAAQDLLEQALLLSPEERCIIIAGIHENLHGPIDPEIEASWIKEVEARIDAYEAGLVSAIPVEEIFKRPKV